MLGWLEEVCQTPLFENYDMVEEIGMKNIEVWD